MGDAEVGTLREVHVDDRRRISEWSGSESSVTHLRIKERMPLGNLDGVLVLKSLAFGIIDRDPRRQKLQIRVHTFYAERPS